MKDIFRILKFIYSEKATNKDMAQFFYTILTADFKIEVKNDFIQ